MERYRYIFKIFYSFLYQSFPRLCVSPRFPSPLIFIHTHMPTHLLLLFISCTPIAKYAPPPSPFPSPTLVEYRPLTPSQPI